VAGEGSLTMRLLLCAVLAVVAASVAGRAQAPAPAQTPVNALIISGGCCHDYALQNKVIIDLLNAVMPIHWTAVQGMTNIPEGKLPFYQNPNYARGYDIVIHNVCWTADPSQPFLQQIAAPHKTGIPAMFFHCSLHSFRDSKQDDWRELIGITSRRHTPSHNITVKWADNDPITAGLPPFVTPIDELYVVEKVWPGTKAIGMAVNGVDNGVQGPNETYPVVWTHEYGGRARVFGTSLGHANETFATNQFKELQSCRARGQRLPHRTRLDRRWASRFRRTRSP
jgi:type 1 glutamine amidotransferase